MKYFQSVSQRGKSVPFLPAVLGIMLGLVFPASAEEFPSSVSVKAILPDNQVSSASYYDLQLSPGDSQTIQMQIINSEENPIVATVELNPATTAIGGTIVYTQSDNFDESLVYSIGEIARIRTPVVEIPANSSALVDVDIDMPSETIDGVILGGLRVTADYPDYIRENSATEQGQGMQIKNKFAYVIGLKLSQNTTRINPDFQLRSIQPGLVNYSTSVIINIRNTEPAIAKNILFTAQVFQKGSQTVLREFKKDYAEMAPNSNCDYVVDWGNAKIQPGDYRVLVRMEHEGRVWEWDETLTVTAGAAGSINDGALGIVESATGTSALSYILGCMLLILIVLLAYVLDKRKLKERKA